jgi:hypothetical protein
MRIEARGVGGQSEPEIRAGIVRARPLCIIAPRGARSVPSRDCVSATIGAVKAATLIAPDCQVSCRTASPISTSDTPLFVLPHLGSPACPIMRERLLHRPAGY